MFSKVPNWVKVLLSLWVVLVIASAFLPAIGTAAVAVGDATGKATPAIGRSVPQSGGWLREQVCTKTEKC